jgi:hypothetical protein
MSAYAKIMQKIVRDKHVEGCTEFEFEREDLSRAAIDTGVSIPKNLGDIIYSYRYRKTQIQEILDITPPGKIWIIIGNGDAKYKFKLYDDIDISPRRGLQVISIPSSTPEIIKQYSMSDEQALLAIVRYNRLIDIFLRITAYSLQNHLRTKVQGMGQIEIDELYIGIDREGAKYVMPVQAKNKTDKHSVVQTIQDLMCCQEKFPDLCCRPVSAQFMPGGRIAMLELKANGNSLSIVSEKHYELCGSSSHGTDIQPGIPLTAKAPFENNI